MNTTSVQQRGDRKGSDSANGSQSEWILQRGREILAKEEAAIHEAATMLGTGFVAAVGLILECRGRVAVTGIGKAGNVGQKIYATLSSTGTPAYVLHPVEALHGDLGMIQPADILLVLSKSGETEELARLIPIVAKIGCKVVLLTAAGESKCARLADVVIPLGDAAEACPLGMAPSSSTAAMMAVGDAIALTIMELKNIQPEQYASFHPGGALGRSLMRVREIMRTDADCPTVRLNDTLADYSRVVAAAPKRAGAAGVVDEDGKLVGIFTHGDLSRLIRQDEHPAGHKMREVMTASPKQVNAEAKVADAVRIMQSHRIDELLVVDDEGRLVGMIDIQDLLAKGFTLFDEN